MLIHKKRIEYNAKSTSEQAFNKLMAKNLSKRFQSSKDEKKHLYQGAKQFLSRTSNSKKAKKDCEKCCTVIVDPVEIKRREFNWHKFSDMTDNCSQDSSERDVGTVSNFWSQNFKELSREVYISTSEKRDHNELTSSRIIWNESHEQKKQPAELKIPKLVIGNDWNRTNIRNSYPISVTDDSNFTIVEENIVSQQNILNRNTHMLSNCVQLKKRSRKFKPPALKDISNTNTLEVISEKTLQIEKNLIVYREKCNFSEQIIELDRISSWLSKEENYGILIKYFFCSMFKRSSSSEIIYSYPTEEEIVLNSKYLSNFKDRFSTFSEHTESTDYMSKSYMMINHWSQNQPSLESFSIKNGPHTTANTKKALKDHKLKKKAIVALKHLAFIEKMVESGVVSFCCDSLNVKKKPRRKNKVLQTHKNAILKKKSSYKMINYRSQSQPILESFSTKKGPHRKKTATNTKKELNDHKLKKKAVVALEHLPLIEKMVKSGVLSFCCGSLNVKTNPRKKDKVLQTHKNAILKKKKQFCDVKNYNGVLSKKFPIVLLPHIDLSLLQNRARKEKTETIIENQYSYHSHSKKSKCSPLNPVVVLRKLDALLMCGKVIHYPVNLESEIIDLTDT